MDRIRVYWWTVRLNSENIRINVSMDSLPTYWVGRANSRRLW